MELRKKYLNIDNCIIIHDVKQIKKEPPQKKIKTKRQLSKAIFRSKILSDSESSIYTKLYRYEKEGFKSEDKPIIEAILTILEVEKEELIKKFSL